MSKLVFSSRSTHVLIGLVGKETSHQIHRAHYKEVSRVSRLRSMLWFVCCLQLPSLLLLEPKPEPFSCYECDTAHLPGLSMYAGYTYRRNLVNPIHQTALLYLGDQTVPFSKFLLRSMNLNNGQELSVFPDPWNVNKGRAYSVLIEEMQKEFGSENVESTTYF